jgi:hypothetical protein
MVELDVAQCLIGFEVHSSRLDPGVGVVDAPHYSSHKVRIDQQKITPYS